MRAARESETPRPPGTAPRRPDGQTKIKFPISYAFKITGLVANRAADTSNLPYVPKALPLAPDKEKVAAGKPVAQAAGS
jgi:hypothetical protein